MADCTLLSFYGLPLLPFPAENHVSLLPIFFVLSCLHSGALSSGDNPTSSKVTFLMMMVININVINNHKSIFPVIISYHYYYWLLCVIVIYIL